MSYCARSNFQLFPARKMRGRRPAGEKGGRNRFHPGLDGNPVFPSQQRRCATHLLQIGGDIRTV